MAEDRLALLCGAGVPVEIRGRKYLVTSPRLKDLAEFEQTIGTAVGAEGEANVNSIRGQTFLVWLALRERQPELTLEAVSELLRGLDLPQAQEIVKLSCPFGGSDFSAEATGSSSSPPANS